jgi:hypothetical protein
MVFIKQEDLVRNPTCRNHAERSHGADPSDRCDWKKEVLIHEDNPLAPLPADKKALDI